jgi:hypothetical protein
MLCVKRKQGIAYGYRSSNPAPKKRKKGFKIQETPGLKKEDAATVSFSVCPILPALSPQPSSFRLQPASLYL